MGVHGLWRLIEPSGKPVPLETLENKVLAVDVSIWLHQAVKGFQDSRGASVPNAHLLGIYHRVCKLLYFRIKPIFVFDGGVPVLKKETMAKRRKSKLKNISEADKIQKQLLDTLMKHTAVSKVLTEKIEASIGTVSKTSSKSNKDEMYKLPTGRDLDSTISSSEDESCTESSTTDSSPSKNWDLHTIDMESVHFRTLPVDVRHEILTDLKETRKQNSWGRLHELPKVSDDFSVYQMRRLLKRQAVQAALEDAEKEMGGKSLSLAELESILKDQGVITNQNIGNRIASDETTKYLLVKDVKKAMEEARKNELQSEKQIREDVPVEIENENLASIEEEPNKTKASMDYEDDLQKAIALSLECEPSTSSDEKNQVVPLPPDNPSHRDLNSEFSFLENFGDADFASSSSDEGEHLARSNTAKMSSAQSYMIEYSGLTPNEIAKIMNKNAASVDSKKLKLKKPNHPTVSEHAGSISLIDTSNKGYKEINDDSTSNNEITSIVDSVGIISSSDSEADEKINLKDINIVINPTSDFKEEDDLFADVFKPIASKTEVISSSEIVLREPKKLHALNIIVNPVAKLNEEDDLFSDVFSNKLETKAKKEEKLASDYNSLETHSSFDENSKLIDKNAPLEEKECIIESQESSRKTLSQEKENLTLQGIDPKSDEVKNDNVESNTNINENADNSLNVAKPSPSSTTKQTKKPPMSEQELRELKDQLHKDKVDLINEKSSKERMAGNITDQMYQEAQELLELFGVPYIIAPMEAEAQCAFLDAIDLTDGTITDDSDIWLFGGQTVYKNFFNQSKFVMEFRSENINHHFKLTREQMILLALLVGSDYTVGIQGVGPVTALEILAAFPPSRGQVKEFSLSQAELLSGLKEFRSWFTKGKSAGAGRSSLKSKLKNIDFTENFPSLQVAQAYLDPKVETSREAFSWGKPNAMALLEFAREKFGWTKLKTEEILNPVLKKLEESRHQKSIRDYFKTRFRVHSGEAESKMSKRVKSAITNMGRDLSEVLAEELQEELKKQPRKTRARRKKEDTEVPELSKPSSSKKSSKANKGNSNQEVNQEGNKIESSENIKPVKNKKRDGVKLDNLKPNSEQVDLSPTPTSQKTENQEKVESKEADDLCILEKINLIRRRRKIKEAKDAIDLKKPKLTKEKTVTSKFLENIPDDLKGDEEVNLLSKIAAQSSEKVEEINKTLQKQLEAIATTSREVSKPNLSSSTTIQPKPSPSNRRPTSRPTRIPRKELIPQKEKDKSMLLRNKLKAIEVFRKGKHGPGFVPKVGKNKRSAKADAELSESSDD